MTIIIPNFLLAYYSFIAAVNDYKELYQVNLSSSDNTVLKEIGKKKKIKREKTPFFDQAAFTSALERHKNKEINLT